MLEHFFVLVIVVDVAIKNAEVYGGDVAGNGPVYERDNQSTLGPLFVRAACPTNRHYQPTGVDNVYPTRFALLFLLTPMNDMRSFQVSVHLVEASDHIMGSFDEKLISYTTRLLENRKV